MDKNKNMKKLLQASEAASDTASQHILLSVSPDGRVHAAGTDNMVTAVVGNAELFAQIKMCMKNNLTKEEVVFGSTHQLDYAPLPCSPSSASWKAMANGRKRAVLTAMLGTAGYGRGEYKMGVGPAPLGWPVDIEWAGFKGATRSKLKVSDVTRIIVSMLQAVGLSPDTHVEHAGDDLDAHVEHAGEAPDNATEEMAGDVVLEVYEVVVPGPPIDVAQVKTGCSGGLKRKYGSA